MTITLEQPRFAERESSPLSREFILPSKSSRELYTGDPTGIISYDFNDAVVNSQHATGEGGTFDLDAETFDAIMPANWRTLTAGEALDAFDRGYKTHVMRMQKVPEAQITAILSHEDSESDPSELTQINGINIPYDVMQSGVDSTEWALAEQDRRLNYVFHEAEYHLGRVFVADGQTYEVTHIEYTGTEGDYQTLTLGFKNLETGQQLLDVPLDQVEALERAETPEQTQEVFEELGEELPEEYEQTSLIDAEERIQAELELYDKEFVDNPDPLERLEFENFLRGHPSLMTTPANLPTQGKTVNVETTDYIEANDVSLEPTTETYEQEVPVEPTADLYESDRHPDERMAGLRAAITRVAVFHPLSKEVVDQTIDELEKQFETEATPAEDVDRTLLRVR